MPESESVPLNCTVTLVLFQPLAFAPGEGVALALGAVLSMLMLLTLAGVALLPALSVQAPLTDWPEPSLVTLTSSGPVVELPLAAPLAVTEATREVASVQVKRTPTSVLFQPFPLAGVSRDADRDGGAASSLTTTGMVVEPAEAPVLLALSVAVQETL